MVYFDNSATSKFKPNTVLNAFMSSARNSANPGRGGHDDSIREGKMVYHARNTILNLLHASPEIYEVVFTSNCTEALNTAIFGLGGINNIITDYRQHNSVLRPVNVLSKSGCNTKIVDKGTISDYIISINENNEFQVNNNESTLVIANQISNVNGEITDINELVNVAHSINAKVLVDGAQSLGHCKIDLSKTPIDMIAGAGHKGLHGLQGVGFLVMKRDIELSPLKYGGTGTDSYSTEQPTEIPESLESGTINACGIHALMEGVKWTEENFNCITAKYRTLSRYCHDLLGMLNLTIYSEYPSTVISFNIDDIPSTEVADYLNTQGIAVRSGLHCAPLMHKHLGTLEQGTVRVSLGVNNSIQELYYLYNALAKFVKHNRK